MMRYKTCGECAFRAVANGGCPIANAHRSETDPACDVFATEIIFCECCGSPVFTKANTIIDMTDDVKPKIRCATCQKGLGTCTTCASSDYCDFASNPSAPMPQMVMKQFRKGNTIVQTEVANPNRVAETCVKNCKCYDPEVGCCRTEGMCGRWVEKITKD